MQSRLHSFIESLTNIAIGYAVAVTSQMLIFPLYGIHIPLTQNLAIGLWFTVISIIRSYLLRRWFTRRTERAIKIEPTAPTTPAVSDRRSSLCAAEPHE